MCEPSRRHPPISGNLEIVTESIDLLTLPEAACRLGVPPKRIQQMLRNHVLAAVTGVDGAKQVPAAFLICEDGGAVDVVKGLPGVLTLLTDAGYNDAEAVRWLFDPDDSLPGTPLEAMRAGRGTEVKRRAQALGF
jgi:Rv2175c C-terminal domain of unknown function/DNA-binding protein Rv2175c, wHTH domain